MLSQDDLSVGESAIYDRQIRLWGSSSQLRIKSASVLFLGVTGTTVEILKNSVLAGAGVMVADDRAVDESSRNFLIDLEVSDTAYMSVSEATVIAARRLNEHPKISSLKESDEVLYSAISSVSALVVSLSHIRGNATQAVALSSECRKKGVGFFLVVDFHNLSWSFSDFGRTHVVESHTAPLKRDERTGKRASDTAIEEFEFVDLEEFISAEIETNFANSKSSFPLRQVFFVKFFLEWKLKDAFAADKESAPSPKRARRSHVPREKSVFREYVESRLAGLCEMEGKLGGFFKINSDELLVDLDQMGETIRCNRMALPHIAAVHGALISQEIIKLITKRDAPLVNQIVMNPLDCGAIVIKTPSRLSSTKIGGGVSPEEDEVQIVQAAGSVDVIEF